MKMTGERFYKDDKGLYLIKKEMFVEFSRVHSFSINENGLMAVNLKIADKLINCLFEDKDKSVFNELSNR